MRRRDAYENDNTAFMKKWRAKDSALRKAQADIARLMPVFDTLRPAGPVEDGFVHAGPVGAGHQMKLLHNYVSLGSVALLAEAAACAQVGGVNAQTFVDVLAMGGGWGAALERMKPFILNQDNTGLRFTVSNALKDLSYYNEMAEHIHADHTVASAIQDILQTACDEGHDTRLMPELVATLTKHSR